MIKLIEKGSKQTKLTEHIKAAKTIKMININKILIDSMGVNYQNDKLYHKTDQTYQKVESDSILEIPKKNATDNTKTKCLYTKSNTYLSVFVLIGDYGHARGLREKGHQKRRSRLLKTT